MAETRVVWSAAALEDVEAIAAFIARDSERYAASVVERFLASARQLADFPLSGREVPEAGSEAIREIFVYSWRLIYHVQGQVVAIAAVVHQRQSYTPDSARFRS